MCKIFVWTPESDYDAQTVIGFANKIINFRAISNLKLQKGTKQAYNNAAKKENGLETAVNIYLKDYDYLLFFIDADGVQSQAQRSKETNSLFNRINRVVMNQKFSGRVKLILFRQELEAWLLVDCLGICC